MARNALNKKSNRQPQKQPRRPARRGKAPYVPEQRFSGVLDGLSDRHYFRNRALLLVSYNCGLRAMELAGLVRSDVLDAEGELVEVLVLRKETTKGEKAREIPLVHSETRHALATWLADHPDESEHAPLFFSQKGGAFSANTMQKLIGHLYKKAGIRASSHSGRRSFATRLIEKGADIYAIQRLMGHESINTTQEYFFASTERLKKVAALLG